MHAIAKELDELIGQLEPVLAAELERAVRHKIADVSERAKFWEGVERDENGYPRGYFEATFGCLADEPFDYPEDLPPEPRADW